MRPREIFARVCLRSELCEYSRFGTVREAGRCGDEGGAARPEAARRAPAGAAVGVRPRHTRVLAVDIVLDTGRACRRHSDDAENLTRRLLAQSDAGCVRARAVVIARRRVPHYIQASRVATTIDITLCYADAIHGAAGRTFYRHSDCVIQNPDVRVAEAVDGVDENPVAERIADVVHAASRAVSDLGVIGGRVARPERVACAATNSGAVVDVVRV